ncbi:MAG: glycosyltransferase [Bacteroidales bacterium]|nr:glycosyltransferase [Bacteroidales bacterium]MCM1415527.1 glycosyltransferase [bacterium]MCM1423727.1 glycosyltransferase [bacterium]
MTFSIIVVCYNAGEKLHKTIESIRSQTEKDYEIIVEDGLSTDGSVEALVPGDDLKIFRERDGGIYDAMNRAVARASGAYLFFLNCGDYFEEETVLARVRHYIRIDSDSQNEKRVFPPRIYYGNIRERATGAAVMSNPKIDDFACYRNIPCHQACFYDRRLLVKRGFHTCYRVRADYEHFLWCYFRAHAVMRYLPVTVVSYEGGGFSETKENRRRSAAEHRHIVRKYMSVGQILTYRGFMLLTLAPLRTYLAGNPVTAGVYQWIKRKLYGRHNGKGTMDR